MKRIRKSIPKVLLLLMIIIASFPALKAEAAKIRISKTKAVLAEGERMDLRMKGTTAKVTWSVKNGSLYLLSRPQNYKGKAAAYQDKSGTIIKAFDTCKRGRKKKWTGKARVAVIPTSKTCTVTARVKGRTYKCVITIDTPELNSTKRLKLAVGDTYNISVKGTNRKVKWKSSNKKVAVISSKGVITAKKKGTTKITATVGKKTYTCSLQVMTKQNQNKSYSYVVQDGRAVITGYEGYGGNISIPAKIENAPVTLIHKRAFYRKKITNAVLPTTLREIGEKAFMINEYLENINIPDNVTEIGEYAFSNCYSLKTINIPKGINEIKNGTFHRCNSLKNIQIPSNITSIGNSAFVDCYSLKKVNIPASVKNLGYGIFSGCTGLTDIVLPRSINEIPNSTFYSCYGLKKINLPDTITKIGSQAFAGCRNLISINIPQNVTSIGSFAFDRCTSLTSITIPRSVTHIGRHAFIRCKNLTIQGYKGSYAESYARENYLKFQEIK